MFDWLIGSAESIRGHIDRFLSSPKTTAEWRTFDSSKKELKQQRIDDLVTAIWGKQNKWYHFGWLIAWRRSRIIETLHADLSDRKLAYLPTAQKIVSMGLLNGWTREAIESTLQRNCPVYKANERALILFLCRNGINCGNPKNWDSFKDAARRVACTITSDSPILPHHLKKEDLDHPDAAALTSLFALSAFPDLRALMPQRLSNNLKHLLHSWTGKPQLESFQKQGLSLRKFNAVGVVLDAIRALSVRVKNADRIVGRLKKFPYAKYFAEHELYLLTQLALQNITIDDCNTWEEYKKAAYTALKLDVEHHVEPLMTGILEQCMPGVMFLHFCPELKKTLPRAAQENLERLEHSPEIDRLMTEAIQSHFTGPNLLLATQVGPDIQESSLDQTNDANKMLVVDIGASRTFPILDRDHDRDPITIFFHRPDGSASAPMKKADTVSFAAECSRLSAHKAGYDARFNTFLQRLLQQYAFTSIYSGWDCALAEALHTNILTMGAKEGQFRADISELPDGSVRIDYAYQIPLISRDLSNAEQRGLFTIPFSFTVQKNPATGEWEIQGPNCKPISYSH
jgi:hypothetical protein